jgi:hypothetical protein
MVAFTLIPALEIEARGATDILGNLARPCLLKNQEK